MSIPIEYIEQKTSLYSDQVNVVLRDRLVPKMQTISLDIARIEPYSFSSAELEDRKRELDYYSMIYDFLSEYITGNEELDSGKLVNVVRLLDSPTRERRSSDFVNPNLKNITKIKTGYSVYIDKLLVTSSSAIVAGSMINITVEYRPQFEVEGNESITLTCGDITQTSDGFSIVLQNKVIPLSLGGTSLTLTAQANVDDTPVSSSITFTIPIVNAVNNIIYYGSGATGLTPAKVQELTQMYIDKVTTTLAFSPADEVMYFAYPTEYGLLTSIKDPNGFELISDFVKSVEQFTISSPNYGSGTVNYNVYEFNNVVTENNYKLTFKF